LLRNSQTGQQAVEKLGLTQSITLTQNEAPLFAIADYEAADETLGSSMAIPAARRGPPRQRFQEN
jgi:hypothetical protein